MVEGLAIEAPSKGRRHWQGTYLGQQGLRKSRNSALGIDILLQDHIWQGLHLQKLRDGEGRRRYGLRNISKHQDYMLRLPVIKRPVFDFGNAHLARKKNQGQS